MWQWTNLSFKKRINLLETKTDPVYISLVLRNSYAVRLLNQSLKQVFDMMCGKEVTMHCVCV